MSEHDPDSVPTTCPDCGADLVKVSDSDSVLRHCTDCEGLYNKYDGWVSEEEIQAVVDKLLERTAELRGSSSPGSPSETMSISEETPQAVHDIREELSLVAANVIPEKTDLEPDEQSELLRRLTLTIHKTAEEYLKTGEKHGK